MTQRRWDTTKRAIWFTLGGIAVALTMLWLQSSPSVTPEEHRYGLIDGWQQEAAPIIAAHPPFQLVDADGNAVVQDNVNANVRLWDAVVKVNGGHRNNYPQQVGDCTSFGAKNAIEVRMCVENNEGQNVQYAMVYPPFLYGVARVQIGKNKVRGDGAVGAWVAQAARDYGVLLSTDNGVPAYSAAVAREWGSKGPPQAFIDIAKARRVKTIAPVKTAAQCRDAICNGYPVTVASMFGSTSIKERDRRQVAMRNTQWAHQMCCIGYDGRGPVAYFYILNSWGPSAHPQPLQGEPPGGFWVTADDMQWITSTGDCWSFSDLDGFPSRELNFNVFGVNQAKQSRAVADARKTTLSF
jgi:hypothetical protein